MNILQALVLNICATCQGQPLLPLVQIGTHWQTICPISLNYIFLNTVDVMFCGEKMKSR